MNQRESQSAALVQYATPDESAPLVSRAVQAARHLAAAPTLLARAIARPTVSPEQAAALRGTAPTLEARAGQDAARSTLDEFLQTAELIRELELWFGKQTLLEVPEIEFLIAQIQRDIAWIDRCLCQQITAVLHHPDFQKLEASWRGLAHLVNCQDRWSSANTKIKVLNASWNELRIDFENATDYDQSEIYWKIHQEGIGQAGAFPFSTMLLDFAVHPKPTREHPCDDIEVLTRLAEVGQAAFCPMIANAHPSMFEEDSFADLRAPKGAHDSLRRDQEIYDALHNSLGFLPLEKISQ